MSARNPDGRFRNHNKPLALSPEMLRSRWLEGEVLRLKRLGFSYEAIAQQITEVGRGQKAPLTPLPKTLPSHLITRSPQWGVIRLSAGRSSARPRSRRTRCVDWTPTVARTCFFLLRPRYGREIRKPFGRPFRCWR